MRSVAMITYSDLPNLHPDDQRVLPFLLKRDVKVVPLVWEWSEPASLLKYSAVIIRSPWDYVSKAEKFCKWVRECESLGVKLWNSPQTVLWNMNKRYLFELASKGVSIPETYGDEKDVPRDGREWVVKPFVSASAHKTFRMPRDDLEATIHREGFQPGTFMVQEFLPEILSPGEISMIFFRGRFSFSFLKTPKTGDFRVQYFHGGTQRALSVPPLFVDQARQILSLAPTPCLYARVDGVIRGETFLLMELEVLEPLLFFETHPPGAEDFADSISELLGP